MMDVGNPDYQARWAQNVEAELKTGDWDGVYVDDVDADASWHLGDRVVAKYPSLKAWQAATRSMIARVGPEFTGQGSLFIANFFTPWAQGYSAIGVWKDWLQFVSGASQEYFTKWGTSSSSWFLGQDWNFRQQFQPATEKAGKIFLGMTYAPPSDKRSLLYARASFLLNTTGGPSALVWAPSGAHVGNPDVKSWISPIGRPVAKKQPVGGAWRRAFSGGAVAVNPSKRTRTVRLGKRYVNAKGRVVSAVTLLPGRGAIFSAVRR